MSRIVFYQKMDCINNGKQKNILTAAGHEVVAVDILLHPWTREELETFVAGRPVAAWINTTAPAVKRGEVKPETLSADEALALMLADHLLIKRPLIEVDGMRMQSFEDPRLKPYLGAWKGEEDVVTCPNLAKDTRCGK